MLLKYFEIIAITEFGTNTFMATNQRTITLFLKRRNNADAFNIEEAVKKLFTNLLDVTINGIEKPLQKYITHVWKDISLADYKTLLQKIPNENIQKHELYQEYYNKIKANDIKVKWAKILDLEQKKLLYFIIAFKQKVVLIKTGEKNKEKAFLGYGFSNRRRSEGIHPIETNKTIDDCTQLYDATTFENPNKASTYIYNAFKGNFNLEIEDNLKENVSYQNLVDMLTFNYADFEKKISLSPNVDNKITSKWSQEIFSNILIKVNNSTTKITSSNISEKGKHPVITQEKENFISGYTDQIKGLIKDVPLIIFGDHSCVFKYIDFDFFRGADGTVLLKTNDDFKLKYVFYFLKYIGIDLIRNKNKYERHLKYLKYIKITKPPKDIQNKIITEINSLKIKSETIVNNNLEKEIKNIMLKYLLH